MFGEVKSYFQPRALLVAMILLPTLPGAVGPAHASSSINHYVAKYKNLPVSEEQRERLASYDHLIEYFCAFAFFQPRHRVNPNFIRALILAESNADPRAVSPHKARGLAQIIHETGRIAAGELLTLPHAFQYIDRKRLQSLRQEDLHDPAINILIACYLVAKYNHRFEGRLDLVVSAWNAGEKSVQQSQAPAIEETRELVGRINGYFLALLRQHEQDLARHSALNEGQHHSRPGS
ncbi:MAG: hypothetical protein BWK76_04945 [Desulfobulbaceae bacterium A2]|nr:MAG: hypothetical protein BWK76_04945 [Desulfobulbaceae bacterium A2]